jgi:uncharacterized membrane protein YbhN (UPF0104 family)
VSVQPTDVGLIDLFVLNLVGMYYNFFAPSTIGGDVLQAEAAKRYIGGRWPSYVTIISNRIIALFAVMVLAVIFSGIWLLFWDNDSDYALYASSALFLVAMGAIAVLFCFRSLTGVLESGGGRWKIWALTARKRFADYLEKTDVIAKVFALAVISNLIGQVAIVWILAEGIGVDVPVLFHFFAVPLIIIVTLIPITLNGIGLREAAFVYLYASEGVAAADAVAISVVLTGLLLLFGLLGGLATLSPRYRLSLE